MSSNINPQSINGSYPVAGQNNSSQGFRDNFTNIKNNLTIAQSEISDLQTKAVLVSALNGQTLNNNMAGAIIGNVQLNGWTQTFNDLGSATGLITVNFNLGNFQKITTAGSIILTLSNWPATTGIYATGVATLRLWVNVSSTSHTLTLPTSINIGVSDIAGYSSTTNAITFDTTGNYVFEITSIDGGSTYLISDVTRNRVSFRDPNLYLNSITQPTLFVGYGKNNPGVFTSLSQAVAFDQGSKAVSAMGSYNSFSVGNLLLANITSTGIDTGKISGYSVTSTRGNLATGTLTPVQNNDYLGYVNAVTYTGTTGTGNVLQQVASIGFYAVGSNVTYGLGGNIAFFTADDGGLSANTVSQAMSINNDQTVQVMGILRTDNGIVERGTYYTVLPVTGGTFTANANVSTVIVDSLSSAAISSGSATIILPTNPPDRYKIKISVLPQVTTTSNIWPGTGVTIKYAPSTIFSSGNTVVQYTYFSSASTWYRS